MRVAFEGVDAGYGEGGDEGGAEFAFHRRRAGRQQALDALHAVALVGGLEGDRIADVDLDHVGLEHHRALVALIEQLDIDIGRPGGGRGGEKRQGGDEAELGNGHGILLRWIVIGRHHT